MSQDDLRAQRVEFIRSLCQGAGWRPMTFIDRADDFDRLFGVHDLDAVAELLSEVFDLMGEGIYQHAIANALFDTEEGGANLTERRTRYLAKVGNISYRTLIKYEQEGAELLVKHLEILLERQARGEDDTTADTMDLEVMRRRQSAMEDDIKLLRQRVTEQDAALEELRQQMQSAVQEARAATLPKPLDLADWDKPAS